MKKSYDGRFPDSSGSIVQVLNDAESRFLLEIKCINTDVFLTHGFLVGENESRAWGSEFFKRFWQERSRARFHNVTWLSDDGTSLSYEQNVNNAFLYAESYATLVNGIKQAKQSEIIVIAHSLGNMFTSAAIEDHDLQANQYFALNGAVPEEAYDPSMANTATNASNRLLHPDWYGYLPKTWASNWYQLFTDPIAFPNDDRAKLTWRGRFSHVTPILYNFWSSGDEVLEISDDDIFLGSGVELDWNWSMPILSVSARRYVWHKQAWFKGRSPIYGTDWAGWNFRLVNLMGYLTRMYFASSANSLSDNTLRTSTVFQGYPPMMFSSTISTDNQNKLLARGIPELSYPIGYTPLECINNPVFGPRNYNMNEADYRRLDLAWPMRQFDFDTPQGSRAKRWLHTDLMNVAHFYTFKLFSKMVEKGLLR